MPPLLTNLLSRRKINKKDVSEHCLNCISHRGVHRERRGVCNVNIISISKESQGLRPRRSLRLMSYSGLDGIDRSPDAAFPAQGFSAVFGLHPRAKAALAVPFDLAPAMIFHRNYPL
jgi:hypothetical protein